MKNDDCLACSFGSLCTEAGHAIAHTLLMYQHADAGFSELSAPRSTCQLEGEREPENSARVRSNAHR
jgi:hypothetical protein